MKNSQLDSLIAPEIKNDDLYNIIQKISSEVPLKNVLEIGSSSGGGSTEAFVKGIKDNPSRPVLYCMEVSKVRFSQLQKTYALFDFVQCYNLSSIPVESFPEQKEVIDFYQQYKTKLNNYSLSEILTWLEQDIDYVASSGVSGNGIKKIKEENNIDFFDLVLIDGSEFTGNTELNEVYGARIIILDDANSFKNYKAHQRLINDENYTLVRKDFNLRNGYSIFKRKDVEFIFPELPVNLFTIVLNGQPFIQYHIDIFRKLPFKWHWHIVEGVAELNHDTGWSISSGGRVTDDIHSSGLSKDGTTSYIDDLVKKYPDNITVYRKSEGEFWDGKKEMVNAPLVNITEECLLWQVDVDELWTVEQICEARRLFIEHPQKTAAYYWCWYFVGEKLVVSTRNCYTQNPQQEWLRTWRFKPGYIWDAHEPPILVERLSESELKNIAKINPFLHEDTEKHNLLFQHYAYTLPEQLKFKETYYGYKEAENQWLKLQNPKISPLFLAEYLSWVKDETMVDFAESLGIVPIAQKDSQSNNWTFLSPEDIKKQFNQIEKEKVFPLIAIDAVFFQFLNTGIARVWRSLFQEWVANGFAKHLLILDRGGTAPRISGIRYRKISPLDYNQTGSDSLNLQRICDEEKIDIFMSTYYTTPISTPSVFLAYDMIPEEMNLDLSLTVWREKYYSIIHACNHIAISKNTASDLCKFFPQISLDSISVAYPGIKAPFSVASEEEINQFKTKYQISKPYFIVVGDRIGCNGYKNVEYFFKSFSKLENNKDLSIVCVGGNSELEFQMASLVSNTSTYVLKLSDEELRIAYSGAIALAYPSLYEGFGLPVLEAMSCGCPVITCQNSSIPEIAEDAALYVNGYNIGEMIDALSKVQDICLRESLIKAGLEQSQKFSWQKMAKEVEQILFQTSQIIKDNKIESKKTSWFRYLREEQRRLPGEYQNLQGEYQNLQGEYQNLQGEYQNLQGEYQNLTKLAQDALLSIQAMKSSKFWKLRSSWFKLKRILKIKSYQ